MSIPDQHRSWAQSLMEERPWIDNDVSSELLQRVGGDKELAAVIFALHRSGSVKWLDTPLQAFGGETPVQTLGTTEGVDRLWEVLQASTAWL